MELNENFPKRESLHLEKVAFTQKANRIKYKEKSPHERDITPKKNEDIADVATSKAILFTDKDVTKNKDG